MALVLDTGPVLALLDASDDERCAALIEHAREPLVVVAPTLVEIDYWIRKRLDPRAWTIFIEDIRMGAYRLEHLSPEDLLRVVELETRYAKLDLGMVDASVIAVCERLREEKVVTLDRRHFGIVKPRHCTRLRILPD
jgi:predicted nucleic acid-binding protein